jgi:DNA polymerase I-like protein with 3'-5' exonuclease and polymerase domains
MQKYCIQDTKTGKAIFKWLRPKIKPFPVPIKIEHRVAEIIAEQQSNGVCINVPRCEDLIDLMQIEKAGAFDKLSQIFAPRVEVMKTPAYWTMDDEYENQPDYGKRWTTIKQAKDDGIPRKWLVPGPLREKHHDFNPGSSDQVAERLKEKYDWDAPLTKAGNPSVTEVILKGLDFPEADMLLHYNMAEKRLQHLTDWVTRARNCRTPGIIHPAINTNGCNTGRMSHSQPNQTAPPKVVHGPDGEVLTGYEGRYGIEMRSCWGPKPSLVQVGVDASGLELRMLGDQLVRFDGGRYAKVVVEGDIHTLNMQAGGLLTRDQAKTTIYAFLYGAGDEHIGVVISKHPSLTPQQRKKYKGRSMSAIGKAFRRQFLKKIKGIEQLQAFCRQAASERGFIHLLDGRRAPIRSEHSALNVLLQGNGAIVMKLALIIAASELQRSGYEFGFMLNCHDEFQLETPSCDAEQVGEICVDAIKEAGTRLKVACPLTGEYKIGNDWSETH